MEDIDVFEIIPQVGTFIGPQDSQGKAEDGPEMDHLVVALVMVG